MAPRMRCFCRTRRRASSGSIFAKAPRDGYALAELGVKDVAYGASPNAFFQALAKDAPRGLYPRGFSGEQPYWTLVGVDGGAESALISEDGALEIARGGFSIEPFILSGSRLVTWADVKATQSLADGYLPVPSVTWQHPEWSMRVTAFARGTRDAAELVARYTVSNTYRPTAIVAARACRAAVPGQSADPVSQSSPVASAPSGRSTGTGQSSRSMGRRRSCRLPRPTDFQRRPSSPAAIPTSCSFPAKRRSIGVTDDTGFASAALIYKLELAPRESRTVGLVAPLAGEATRPDLDRPVR